MPTHARNKELKPPPELVEAIQASEDGVAPTAVDASGEQFSGNVPRTERVRLMHEEPQHLSHDEAALAAEVGHQPGLMSHEDMQQGQLMEQHAQQKAAQFDNRSHVMAGRQGQGTVQVDSTIGIGRHDRGIKDGGAFQYHMHNKEKGAHGK